MAQERRQESFFFESVAWGGEKKEERRKRARTFAPKNLGGEAKKNQCDAFQSGS